MDKPSPSTSATTVRASVPFISGETQTELIEGELVFDHADPYAVVMHLEARSGTVTWTFARELLDEGRYTPVGDGDVQVWPCLSNTGEAVVIIELRSPDGVVVNLSGGEFSLLRVFVERPQRVLTRDQLLDLARGPDSDAYDRAIDVQISRLRRKLDDGGSAAELIRTVRNEGYMFMAKVSRR